MRKCFATLFYGATCTPATLRHHPSPPCRRCTFVTRTESSSVCAIVRSRSRPCFQSSCLRSFDRFSSGEQNAPTRSKGIMIDRSSPPLGSIPDWLSEWVIDKIEIRSCRCNEFLVRALERRGKPSRNRSMTISRGNFTFFFFFFFAFVRDLLGNWHWEIWELQFTLLFNFGNLDLI